MLHLETDLYKQIPHVRHQSEFFLWPDKWMDRTKRDSRQRKGPVPLGAEPRTDSTNGLIAQAGWQHAGNYSMAVSVVDIMVLNTEWGYTRKIPSFINPAWLCDREREATDNTQYATEGGSLVLVCSVARHPSSMNVPKTAPLRQQTSPFDDPDWTYEIKHDGFRDLAINWARQLPIYLAQATALHDSWSCEMHSWRR